MLDTNCFGNITIESLNILFGDKTKANLREMQVGFLMILVSNLIKSRITPLHSTAELLRKGLKVFQIIPIC